MSQAASTNVGEPSSADIGTTFLNIPVPTTELMTKIMADSRPILGRIAEAVAGIGVGVEGDVMG